MTFELTIDFTFPRKSVEASYFPQGGDAGGEQQQAQEQQHDSRGPIQSDGGPMCSRARPDEGASGDSDQQPIQPGAALLGYAGAAFHPRAHKFNLNAAAAALTLGRLHPFEVFRVIGEGKANGGQAQRHQQRAPNSAGNRAVLPAAKFAKGHSSPQQAPELIGVGDGNAAADADIFDRVLLEDVANDPHKAGGQQPEEHVFSAGNLPVQAAWTAHIGECKRRHHAQFADGEERNEGKGIHAREISFAVGDVHGPPEHARAQGGGDAAAGDVGGNLAGGGAGQQHAAQKHDQGATANGAPAPPAGVVQLTEEEDAPYYSDEGVSVPQRKRNAQAQVADSEDGERVGHRPKAAGDDGPDDQVGGFRDIGANAGSAAHDGGQAPAAQENPGDHEEGNQDRGDAGGDQFGGNFGGAQPGAGGNAAENAHALQCSHAPGRQRRRAGGT